jgi:general secretion pathway protein J
MDQRDVPELTMGMNQQGRVNQRFKKKLNTLGFRVFTDTGFTLIEMVITLTILGFIVLLIFGAFRLGLSASERGNSIKEEYQEVRILSQLISQQLKSIVPYKIKTKQEEGDYLAFEGKAQSLRFVSTLSMKANQPEGLVYTVYEFRGGAGGKGSLVLHEAKAQNRDFFEDKLKEESEVVLFEGISEIHFEYYKAENKEKNVKEEWVKEWNTKEENELPKAVRMSISYMNGKGEIEPLPITILASIPANQFEDMGKTQQLFGPRSMGTMQQGR